MFISVAASTPIPSSVAGVMAGGAIRLIDRTWVAGLAVAAAAPLLTSMAHVEPWMPKPVSRGRPTIEGVATLAVGPERRAMPGGIPMTVVTTRRGTRVLTIWVAGFAGHIGMTGAEGQFRFGVVKGRGPTVGLVTGFAVGAVHALVRVGVTFNACRRRTRILPVGVTIFAGNVNVLAGQRKTCHLRMVERGRKPALGGVTLGAVCPQTTRVRIRLAVA